MFQQLPSIHPQIDPRLTVQTRRESVMALRLATELAEDGNFVDARRTANRYLSAPRKADSLDFKLAEKLVSREQSSISCGPSGMIYAIIRCSDKPQPNVVSRNRVGQFKLSSSPQLLLTADHLTLAPNASMVVTSVGKQLSFLHLATRQTHRTDGHDSNVWLLAVSDDASIAASFGDDNQVRIWDGQTATPLTSIPLRDVASPYLSITPSGEVVCIAVGNGPARYLNLKGDGEIHLIRPRGTHATSICALPNARAFVVGCQDGGTRIIEVKMSREAAVLQGDGSPVEHVTVSGDGKKVLAQTANGRVSVFELATAERTHVWQLASDLRHIKATFTSNEAIAIPNTSNSVSVIPLEQRDLWARPKLGSSNISDARLCSNESILLCGDTSGQLFKISTITGAVSNPLLSHRRRIEKIRNHPLDKRLVTMSSWDGTASIFDIESLEPVMMFSGHSAIVRDAMLSPNGKVLVSVSIDNTCRFWDARTGKVLSVIAIPEQPLGIIVQSENVATLIGQTGAVYRVLGREKRVTKVIKSSFSVSPTAVTSDSTRTVIVGGSKIVVVNNDKPVVSQSTIAEQATACHLDPSGRLALIGTNTGNVQVWDIQTMTSIIDAECADCAIQSLGCTKSGSYIFAVGVDGIVRTLSLRGDKS